MSYLSRESLAPITANEQQIIRNTIADEIDNHTRIIQMLTAMLDSIPVGAKKLSTAMFRTAMATVTSLTPDMPVIISADTPEYGSRDITFHYREKTVHHGRPQKMLTSITFTTDRLMTTVLEFMDKLRNRIIVYNTTLASLQDQQQVIDRQFIQYNELIAKFKELAIEANLGVVSTIVRQAMPLLKIMEK